MTSQTLPINEIIVEDRQRKDLGDIHALAESLSRFGLIQPIVLTQERRLIAGGRRLAAALQLGWTSIAYVYRETLSKDELHELELEENVRRKDMSWQERCLSIATIHQLKSKRSALEGQKWGYRETGELLSVALGPLSFSIKVAAELKANPESDLWKCESAADAYRLLLRRKQDEVNAELARRTREAIKDKPLDHFVVSGVTEYVPILPPADQTVTCPVCNGTKKHPSGGSCEHCRSTGVAWKNGGQICMRPIRVNEATSDLPITIIEPTEVERILTERELTIPISSMLYHADAISFMRQHLGEFDHIITDPPYGIDMDMLNQQNPHGQMVDIDTILEEHKVEENESLFESFFPAAYSALKENGFLVLWCDQMQWDNLYNLADIAGFKVQRWPLTWVKTHRCMNQSAQYNFTKTTEIAMVCRKGNAILVNPAATCHIIASHDEYKEQLGHPFVKPFDVWEFILQHVSLKGQTILEPFAGRGSGVISALRMERNVIATECNEAHYNALMENVKRYYLDINSKYIFK